MAMDFAGASNRVRGLLASKRPQDLSKSALTPDRLRDNIIDEAGARSERFSSALEKRPSVTYDRGEGEETFSWDTYPEAVKDAARALFGWDEPEVVGRDRVRKSHMLNRDVMDGAVNSPGFAEMRPMCRNNEVSSTAGALALGEELSSIVQTKLADHVDRSQRLSEHEQEMQSAQDMLDQLRQQAKQEVQDVGAVQDQTRRDIKRAVKDLDHFAGGLQQILDEPGIGAQEAAAIAAGAQAAKAAAEVVDGIGNIPGIAGGNAHNLSLDQQIELAELWTKNPLLRNVARMLGRMLRSMSFKRKARVKNVGIRPVGVTTGNDIERLLPHEVARAVIPNRLAKAVWVQDFAQRRLLQYDTEGEAPAGKGPMIPVHDGSGSMSGEKFVWATSLVLSLLTIANREKREFAAIEFGSAGQKKTWIFRANEQPDPHRVLDLATHFFAGGTSTYTGMAEALQIMREHPEFRTADVVLIGDGQDTFREPDRQVRDELRALGCRIHGISIMQSGNRYMQQMCEYVVDVSELAGPNDATDRLAANVT